MTRRTVWAVSSGDYSSYSVHAIFDSKADAQAVCERLNSRRTYGEYDVEEFPAYSAGDSSYAEVPVWEAYVCVNAAGKILSEPHCYLDDHADSDSLGSSQVDRRPYDNVLTVRACGRTEQQAIKGAKDLAAQVAAELLDGVDPREIARSELTSDDIAAAHIEALAEEQRLQVERDRVAAEQRRRAVLAETALRKVALFDDDTQVGDWGSFGTGYVVVPTSFVGDMHALRPRFEDGETVDGAQFGQLLRPGRPPDLAVMWPRFIPPEHVEKEEGMS